MGGVDIITSMGYNSTTGSLKTRIDPNGFAADFQYDNKLRLKKTIFPPINSVRAERSTAYDDTNCIVTVTDEKGNFTKQYFDTLGRLFKTERYDAGVLKSTETLGYNWQSKVKTRIDSIGQYATFEYDILERPTKTIWNDGKLRTTTYADSENTVTVTDENSHQRIFAYDWQGRLIAVKEFLNATSFYQTNYYYDAVGNLLRVVDAKNQTTVNPYDDLNRLTQIIFPDGFTETRSYDDVGNLLSRRP